MREQRQNMKVVFSIKQIEEILNIIKNSNNKEREREREREREME
jgi:hypothetical protein